MSIVPTNIDTIKEAAELLREGQLVAFPTETVYGLGGDATNDIAVAEIFSAKGRPAFNPLIIHFTDIALAKQHVVWNEAAEKLAKRFCPGPFTMVLKKSANSKISLLASAGGETLGIRFPSNKAAQDLLKAAGVPVAAPSANRSGHVSPTLAKHVAEEFGDTVPCILDGGACEVGIESTVIDLSGDKITLLRPGAITREEIELALGQKIEISAGASGALKSPGMLESHYAPSLPVRLNVTTPQKTEALLAFGSPVPTGAKTTLNLSESGNLKEAAARLFACLRELDKPDHYSAIAIMPIPQTGIGIAINDRLNRAAK